MKKFSKAKFGTRNKTHKMEYDEIIKFSELESQVTQLALEYANKGRFDVVLLVNRAFTALRDAERKLESQK